MAFPSRRSAPASKPSAETVPYNRLNSSKPQPLDPHELARRLRLVLVDAKTSAERKELELDGTASSHDHRHQPDRESSDEPAKRCQKGSQHQVKLHLTTSTTSASNQPGGESERSTRYRHIPQEAASQFARTTTVQGNRRLSHRLSTLASTSLSDGTTTTRPETTAPSRQPQQHECNWSQQSPVSATMAGVNEPQSCCPHRHTFDSQCKTRGQVAEPQQVSRRKSTGGILARSGWLHSGPLDRCVGLPPVDEQRKSAFLDRQPVDWTQSDESCVQSTSAMSSYIVRKHELALLLRGRLGSFALRSKDGESTSERAAPSTSKSSGSGLFARFRR